MTRVCTRPWEDEARALYEDHPEIRVTAIGERFGVSRATIAGLARSRGWKRRPPRDLAHPWEAEARLLWEHSDLTGSQIAARLGTTKNTVAGLAWRRGWTPRTRPGPTLRTRMDDLERQMDDFLASNPRLPSHVRILPSNARDARLEGAGA